MGRLLRGRVGYIGEGCGVYISKVKTIEEGVGNIKMGLEVFFFIIDRYELPSQYYRFSRCCFYSFSSGVHRGYGKQFPGLYSAMDSAQASLNLWYDSVASLNLGINLLASLNLWYESASSSLLLVSITGDHSMMDYCRTSSIDFFFSNFMMESDW